MFVKILQERNISSIAQGNFMKYNYQDFLRTGLQVQIVHKDLASKRGPNNNITI